MSILISESYTNGKAPLWRSVQPTTTAPVQFTFNGGSNTTPNKSTTLTGLTVGQRYTFTFNFFVIAPSSTLSALLDGTNGYALSCSATTLPLELQVQTNLLSTAIHGIFLMKGDWVAVNYAGTTYITLGFQTQITLTVQTSSVTFTIQPIAATPSVNISNLTMYDLYNWYTTPII